LKQREEYLKKELKTSPPEVKKMQNNIKNSVNVKVKTESP
tara:strand:+ start:1284 stop:1403 length:120 start_codon:yes stop_codon:yes gene_type:complete